jgi:hypothetical protein
MAVQTANDVAQTTALILADHQSPARSAARISSNSPAELTRLDSLIRSLVAGCDLSLYQYQPGLLGVFEVQCGGDSITSATTNPVQRRRQILR